MKDEIVGKLREYERAVRDGWLARDREMAAKKDMDRMCGSETRRVKFMVRKIMREARKEWHCVQASCTCAIDHTKPISCSLRMRVRVLYCQSKRRGCVELYGDFDEMDELMAELKRLVCG